MSPDDIAAYDVTGSETAENAMGWLRAEVGSVCLTEKMRRYDLARSDELNYVGLSPEEGLKLVDLISERIYQLGEQVIRQVRSQEKVGVVENL